MRSNDPARTAFTLVELILVMAVLATVMAISAPRLARSFRQRNLEQEATRFVALTEFARQEAVSQGVPMIVWIDVQNRTFGEEPKPGYSAADVRTRQYTLGADARFDNIKLAAVGQGRPVAAEFAADGTLAPGAVESLRLLDRFDSAIVVAQTTDGWGYEVVKEETK